MGAVNLSKVPGKPIMVCLAGSKAYGTSLPTSDTDIRGIFVADPKSIRTPWHTVGEHKLPDEEDGKLYELNKFMELFVDMNPNIVELMFVRESEILYSTDEYWELRKYAKQLLSKKAAFKFSGYAMSQLKRIKGHNKWLNNPQPKEPPTQKEYIRLVHSWMEGAVLKHEDFMRKMENMKDFCSLVPYGNNTFGVSENFNKPGLFNKDGTLKEVDYESLSDQDKKRPPIFVIKYLAEEHKQAKLKHLQYWEWKNNRNEARSELEEKFGYDTKHAMHLVRLLRMGKEILKEGEVNVWREDAQDLLEIRNGKYSYEEIVQIAEAMQAEVVGDLSKETKLPGRVNIDLATELLMDVQDMAWEPQTAECPGCGKRGVVNYEESRFYCGGSDRCIP